MIHRTDSCDRTAGVRRKDGIIAAGLTLGSALVVAAIMLIGRNEVTKTIGLTMVPGVLAVGTQWLKLGSRSLTYRIAVIGGTFAVLALIGLAAGLAIAA